MFATEHTPGAGYPESRGQYNKEPLPRPLCPVAVAPAPTPVAVAAPEPAPVMERSPSGAFFGPFIGLEHRTRDLCNCVDDVSSGLIGMLGGMHFPIGRERPNLLMQVGAAVNLKESKWSTLFAAIGLDYALLAGLRVLLGR